MTPNPPKKLSIAEQGGIAAYLEASKSKHKGLNLQDLLNRVELDVPWTRIAEDFGVRSRETVKKWVEAYKAETGAK